MDLCIYKPEPENVLEVKHPITGEDTGIRITCYSKDSAEYEQIFLDIMSEAKDLPKDQRKSLARRIVAGCVKSWEGIEWDGEVLKCTPKNALMLVTELKWLYEQIDVFTGSRANFFTKESGSSAKPSDQRSD